MIQTDSSEYLHQIASEIWDGKTKAKSRQKQYAGTRYWVQRMRKGISAFTAKSPFSVSAAYLGTDSIEHFILFTFIALSSPLSSSHLFFLSFFPTYLWIVPAFFYEQIFLWMKFHFIEHWALSIEMRRTARDWHFFLSFIRSLWYSIICLARIVLVSLSLNRLFAQYSKMIKTFIVHRCPVGGSKGLSLPIIPCTSFYLISHFCASRPVTVALNFRSLISWHTLRWDGGWKLNHRSWPSTSRIFGQRGKWDYVIWYDIWHPKEN